MTNHYCVDEIQLIKFDTPKVIKGRDGVQHDRSSHHWGCLINRSKLVHFTDNNTLTHEEWDTQFPGAYPPYEVCTPYSFTTTRTIFISTIMDVNDCHVACKEIFKLLRINILVCIYRVYSFIITS